jgi:extradiol dioxygenase family protein
MPVLSRKNKADQAPIIHLAVPVRNLEEARAFYLGALGCEPGRATDEWIDVWFHGCQVTLHLRPNEVLPAVMRGVRHFGVSLPGDQWSAAVERCQAHGVATLDGPRYDDSGAYKVKLEDPSGNVIELKSYPDQAALRPPGGAAPA